MTDVTFTRKEYQDMLPIWQQVDRVCAGEKAVKAAGEDYLPKPNPLDKTDANKKRYDQYKLRAVFYGATARTLEAMVGLVYRRKAQLTTPIKGIDMDVDGAGVSIYQQSQAVLESVMKGGRHALWVDNPDLKQFEGNGIADAANPKKKELEDLGIRPTILERDAMCVINWRTAMIRGKLKLTLVVLSEVAQEVTEDGFGLKDIKQYRVLRLGQSYSVEIWREKERGKWEIDSEYSPLMGNGKPWTEIPFTFVGAKNNDADVDKAPLYDLSVLNIAHYRNSADYEESVFLTGQPTLVATGLDQTWADKYFADGKAYLGSRGGLPGPEGSSFDLLQADPNTLAKEAMDQKEKQMGALGGRLLTKGEAVKTATEAQGDQESEHSVLSLGAENVSSGYTQALKWAEMFVDEKAISKEDTEFLLNTDFLSARLDPQMIAALISAFQSGKLPESDLYAAFRQGGLIDPEKDDEAINDEIANQSDGLALEDDEDDDDVTAAA